MKQISNFINESQSKFCIEFFNKMWDKKLVNDWKSAISEEPIKSATYWAVMSMS